MFPLDVRLSTWVALLACGLLAAYRADWRFLVGGAAWLAGFEAAYEASSVLAGHPLPDLRSGPFALIAAGGVVVLAAGRRGVRPSGPVMVLVAAVWLVWVVTGFHVNGHDTAGLDPAAEALNEVAKTLWAIAYLLPLWRSAGIPGTTRANGARRRSVSVSASSAATIAVARMASNGDGGRAGQSQ